MKPIHKEFANEFMDTGNGTQSAKKVFDIKGDEYAAVKASRLLRNDKIREYIESKADKAASMVFKLSQEAENEAVRLNACKDVLDRGGHKPVENVDIKSGGEKIVGINYIAPETND